MKSDLITIALAWAALVVAGILLIPRLPLLP
jgi:hypothetical protein